MKHFRISVSHHILSLTNFLTLFLSGIEKKKGTMDYGSDADLIIVDHDMTLHSTYVAGQCVYQRDIHIER